MNTKLRAWVHATRPRTLPLSSAGAILGSALAYRAGFFSWKIALLCLLTVLLLQVLSNLANDLGDSQKGTDNAERKGPLRSVQSGIILQKEMKSAIFLCIILALSSGLLLLFFSFSSFSLPFLLILLTGLLGIAAAIKYTVGRRAYGYYGFGDVFVFFFFGWIPVSIAYYTQTHEWNSEILLPGLAVGLLSTAVLNLNNLRDYENDKKCGKKTLIVNWGIAKGKLYHTALVELAILSVVIYTFTTYNCLYDFLCFIAFIPLMLNIKTVLFTKDSSTLDPELKKVALSTLLLVLLWTIGFIVCPSNYFYL